MNDDLVKRLREYGRACTVAGVLTDYSEQLAIQAADRIEALQEEVGVTRTEKHADAECIGTLESALAKADKLKDVIDKPDQYDALHDIYCYDCDRVDATLAAYRVAREATK